MENKELFTDKIIIGNRNYFFDIKKADNDSLYLTISESKRTDRDYRKSKILVFEEDIKSFKMVLNRIVKKMDGVTSDTKEKSYIFDDIRKQYSQAYQPWSNEDDERLEILYCEGKAVKELAAVFERTNGAITSRIKKLELREKYG